MDDAITNIRKAVSCSNCSELIQIIISLEYDFPNDEVGDASGYDNNLRLRWVKLTSHLLERAR